VRATGNHQFLTIHGWQRLDQLQPGVRIALPRTLPSPAVATMDSISSRQLQARMGQGYCGTTLYRHNMSRHRAQRVADIAGSDDLRRLAASDVYWDSIVSIEPDGVEPVYDLTVPGNHNFIAGNIIVHNSIEQDADVVLFIYREDYYIEDSDKRNIAEVLVAKHRHGATGQASLYFRKDLTQFRDLDTQRTELDY
jgi:replicative DNA helicase